MAPENELLSSYKEELRQQASQGSGREELEGGGEEQEGEIEMLDPASPVRYIDMTYRLSIYRHF